MERAVVKMRAMSWKEGKVVSVYAREGVFFLVQILKPPYLAVFDVVQDSHDWPQVGLTLNNVLFVKAVTRQFIKYSDLRAVDIQPVDNIEIPLRWINGHPGSRLVTLYKGTENEVELISNERRAGGRLIEQSAEGGVEMKIIIPEISLADTVAINSHELTTIDLFPHLNERVYLRSVFNRNVDPAKDIKFDRELPIEYLYFVKIYAGKIDDISAYRSE